MNAILLAGGIPKPENPLYEYTRGKPKALLKIAGKPMIQWVLDALHRAKEVENIILVSLSSEVKLTSSKPMVFVPDHISMFENIRAGSMKVLEMNPNAHHVLIVSSDIPAITAEMVDWLIQKTMTTDHDIYYTVIKREVMLDRFPNCGRTFVRLKDITLTGGNISVIRTFTTTGRDELFQRMADARKNPFKMASLFGYDTLLLVLLRALTLEKLEKKICAHIGLKGRAVLCPFAEVGMDVDNPLQLNIMEEHMASRKRS